MSPQRVQRRRVKGWRAPVCSCGCGEPARYVGRGRFLLLDIASHQTLAEEGLLP